MKTVMSIIKVFFVITCLIAMVSGAIAGYEGLFIGDRTLRMAGLSYAATNLIIIFWVFGDD